MSSDRRVFKNTIILLIGAGASKFLGIMAMPILSRLYGPEDFGLLSLYVGLTFVLSAVASLRYSVAIPIPKSEALSVNVLVTSLLLSFLFCFLLIFFVSASFLFDIDWGPYEMLKDYALLLVSGVLFMSMYEAITFWMIRYEGYGRISKSQIFETISGVGGKLGLGGAGVGSGLLYGQFLQQFIAFSYVLSLTKKDIFRLLPKVNKIRLFRVIKLYREMAIYRTPGHFFLIFSMQAPAFLSAAIYDLSTTGQVGLAMTALATPVSLIGVTAGKAYYGEITKIGKADPYKIRNITKRLAIRLFIISLLPTIIFMMWSKEIFLFVFGEKWYEAGSFAQMFSLYLPAQFVAGPLASTFNLFGGQKMVLSLNVCRFLLVLIVFGSGYLLGMSSHILILVYSIVMLLYYILYSCFVFSSIK